MCHFVYAIRHQGNTETCVPRGWPRRHGPIVAGFESVSPVDCGQRGFGKPLSLNASSRILYKRQLSKRMIGRRRAEPKSRGSVFLGRVSSSKNYCLHLSLTFPIDRLHSLIFFPILVFTYSVRWLQV